MLLESIIFQETVNLICESEDMSIDQRVEQLGKLFEKERLLKFSTANTKVGENIPTFSLPAGWTCPFAKDCLMKVDKDRAIDPATGKIGYTIGKDTQYMCYAAWMEIRRKAIHTNRWHNYNLLEEQVGVHAKADLIGKSIMSLFKETGKEYDSIRIHESGDFYNGEYFQAWLEVARRMPNIKFYAYTKALPYLIEFDEQIKKTPNMVITISTGGKAADLEDMVDHKKVVIYNTPEEALAGGHLIDLDDSIARSLDAGDFGLLVHGMQTKDVENNPDVVKNKARNEVFLKYHKHKHELANIFGYDEDHIITKEEAIQLIAGLDKKLQTLTKRGEIDYYKELRSLLLGVVKYNEYNFSDDLLAVLPPAYRN